jgi:hypothetical protein
MIEAFVKVRIWSRFLDVISICKGKFWRWFLDVRSICKGKILEVVSRG